MKKPEQYVTKGDKTTYRVIEDEAVILNLDSGFYYSLNRSGTAIWELLDGETGVRTVAERLSKQFDVCVERALEDVHRLVQNLLKEGLVRVLENPQST